MLRELLKRKGAATVTEVARALLNEDRSQLEYYEQVTKNMVGRVLTANRGITEKDRVSYRLKDFSRLSNEETRRRLHISRQDFRLSEIGRVSEQPKHGRSWDQLVHQL